ncbi:hypothetical protein C8R43DRAFT_1205869 [Mycena crocata]|nr:hypothetical protein C8R43DRAFT_1205869 [Mycena crocata]
MHLQLRWQPGSHPRGTINNRPGCGSSCRRIRRKRPDRRKTRLGGVRLGTTQNALQTPMETGNTRRRGQQKHHQSPHRHPHAYAKVAGRTGARMIGLVLAEGETQQPATPRNIQNASRRVDEDEDGQNASARTRQRGQKKSQVDARRKRHGMHPSPACTDFSADGAGASTSTHPHIPRSRCPFSEALQARDDWSMRESPPTRPHERVGISKHTSTEQRTGPAQIQNGKECENERSRKGKLKNQAKGKEEITRTRKSTYPATGKKTRAMEIKMMMKVQFKGRMEGPRASSRRRSATASALRKLNYTPEIELHTARAQTPGLRARSGEAAPRDSQAGNADDDEPLRGEDREAEGRHLPVGVGAAELGGGAGEVGEDLEGAEGALEKEFSGEGRNKGCDAYGEGYRTGRAGCGDGEQESEGQAGGTRKMNGEDASRFGPTETRIEYGELKKQGRMGNSGKAPLEAPDARNLVIERRNESAVGSESVDGSIVGVGSGRSAIRQTERAGNEVGGGVMQGGVRVSDGMKEGGRRKEEPASGADLGADEKKRDGLRQAAAVTDYQRISTGHRHKIDLLVVMYPDGRRRAGLGLNIFRRLFSEDMRRNPAAKCRGGTTRCRNEWRDGYSSAMFGRVKIF